jgi:hypothetical protein
LLIWINTLLSHVWLRAWQETSHCVPGGLVLNFTQKSSHTSRYSSTIRLRIQTRITYHQVFIRILSKWTFKIKILLYDYLKDTVTLWLLAWGGSDPAVSLNRSVPPLSGMYRRHGDPQEDTTSTPADYIMDSYAVRGPCERPFLNRGIVHFHEKTVYGAKNAAAIMVSSSMLIMAKWYLARGHLTVVNLHRSDYMPWIHGISYVVLGTSYYLDSTCISTLFQMYCTMQCPFGCQWHDQSMVQSRL